MSQENAAYQIECDSCGQSFSSYTSESGLCGECKPEKAELIDLTSEGEEERECPPAPKKKKQKVQKRTVNLVMTFTGEHACQMPQWMHNRTLYVEPVIPIHHAMRWNSILGEHCSWVTSVKAGKSTAKKRKRDVVGVCGTGKQE